MTAAVPGNVTLIMLDAPGGVAEAYLAQPEGPARGGVVLFMDAFGLRPRIAEMTARIASWGYGVIAPHVFYRCGSAAELSLARPLLTPQERVAFFTPEVMSRIDGYSAEQGRADNPVWIDSLTREFGPVPAGTTGYCFGARLATRLAGQFPGQVAAAGGWHGAGLVTGTPGSPHTFLAAATAEFHYGHADNDPGMTPENIADLGAALGAAGLAYHNEVFTGAQHGYTMSDTPAYSAPHEARHWRALHSLFSRALR